MKLGTLLLGTAAGLMVVTGAQAADLPGEPVPAAVDYVKVCDAFGAGFFYIPGSETCLDISGRVRFRVQYDGSDDADAVLFRADARLQFDARTATEYGTLRSFIELSEGLKTGDGHDDNGLEIDKAFISIGYVTFGLQGDVANGDVLYGDNSFAYMTGDDDLLGITVLADDLGGGFYLGGGVYSNVPASREQNVWVDGTDPNLELQAVAGIAGQPWGSVGVSFTYDTSTVDAGKVLGPIWTVKADADLTIAEGVDARLVAAYADYADESAVESRITLAGAVSFAATEQASIYAGLRYDIVDGADDDEWKANLGVDYAIVSGLTLTAEASYADEGPNEAWQGLLQLSRTW